MEKKVKKRENWNLLFENLSKINNKSKVNCHSNSFILLVVLKKIEIKKSLIFDGIFFVVCFDKLTKNLFV